MNMQALVDLAGTGATWVMYLLIALSAVQLALISVKLTDPELLVALAVDRGTATVDGLAVTVPLDRLTLRRTIIGLMERGYLVVATSAFGVDRH